MLSAISDLLSPSCLTPEQQSAVTALYEANRLVIAPMGTGKTVIAASAIAELLDDGELERVLIVTTPQIARTVWQQEFAKWQHTAHIQVAPALGSPDARMRTIYDTGNQAVVITFNTLDWMHDNQLFQHFDGLLIDETSKLKSAGSRSFKSLRPHLKDFKWRAGLTGTPVSENLESLYTQAMLIDAGKALGTRKDAFMRRYFYQVDFKGYRWAIQPEEQDALLAQVAPLIHSVPDYRDTLPPINYVTERLTLPDNCAQVYDEMRKDMVTGDVVAENAAVMTQKLQQIASGFIYDNDGEAHRLSDYRVQALTNIVRGQHGVVICYQYQDDLDALRAALPHAEVLRPATTEAQIERFNAGEIAHLLIHPKSAGHGIQLQHGGHTVVWYTPVWSRDLWEQTNARVWRQGQRHPVTVVVLEAQGTVDELISARVEDKRAFHKLLMEHLNG